jgi:hypothetical protein
MLTIFADVMSTEEAVALLERSAKPALIAAE